MDLVGVEEALLKFIEGKSLRFWVALGMFTALAPLAVSALGGFILLDLGVIRPFSEVAHRQRYDILPVQNLRLLILETAPSIDDYVELKDYRSLDAYRAQRQKVEREFSAVSAALKDEPSVQELLERARRDWVSADQHANRLISDTAAHTTPQDLENQRLYQDEIAAANDKLTAIHDRLDADLKSDHDTAVRAYERAIWIAAIAAVLALQMVFAGVYMIGRIMASSVDRLVKGASRFAEGDRNHRIEIAVPPELQRVAEEFNHMIERIHDSEQALSMLAHEDSLTKLGNRRAFDDAFAEVNARQRRFGEEAAVLVIDIDLFKRVNDSYGHAVGDQALSMIADLMTRNIRPFDKVFRLGGEEFVAILPGADSFGAVDVAERLRETIAATPFETGSGAISLTVSIGVATTRQTTERTALLEAADAALYRAKETGRNRVIVSDRIGQDIAG
jgi:diguanylate cyclase (GGDEF)-like protein